MKTMEWGLLIVSYLFLGGLSAGLFFVSALATLLGRSDNRHERMARYGAMLAPWPVMFGCALLVFDLGHWYRFYKLFLHLEWTSPMSIGSWLLTLFIGAALLFAYSWTTAAERDWFLAKLPHRLSSLRILKRDPSPGRLPLALTGLPLSIGVGIYTGVLLGAVQARPFWNTSLVAQMFLFSALSSGCAGLILLLGWRGLSPTEFRLLYLLDVCCLTIEFFIVMPYVVHGQLSAQAVRGSLELILGGPFTILFWVFFLAIGLVAPLIMEAIEVVPVLASGAAVHPRRALVAGTAMLVLAGGVLLRYIFVYAGQMSVFR